MSSFSDDLGSANILYAPFAPLVVLGEGSNLFRRNTRFVRPTGSKAGQVQYRVKIKRQIRKFLFKIRWK